MRSETTDRYWETIAQSQDIHELRRVIASGHALVDDALSELSDLLVKLEPLSVSAAVDQLRWLGIELAEASGDHAVRARLRALRLRQEASEALGRGDKAQAVENLSDAAETVLAGDSIEEAIRTTHFAVAFLLRLGEASAGLHASERMIEAVEKCGFESRGVRISLYEFVRVTGRAPAGEGWKSVLARIRMGMEQAGDLTAATAVACHLAIMLIRQGAYEEGLELLADQGPDLPRLALLQADGKVSPAPESVHALLWKARALDLTGREAEAEDAYRFHPWFREGMADERAEIITRLAEFLIENNRMQEALDLLESSQPQDTSLCALTYALIGLVYAALNRPEVSAAAENHALSLLDQRPPQEDGTSPFLWRVIEGTRALETLYTPDDTHWRIHLAVTEAAVLRRQVGAEHQAKLDQIVAYAHQNGERALKARCLRLGGEIALTSGDARAAVKKLEAALACELVPGGTQQWKRFSAEKKETLPELSELRTEQVRRTRLEAGVGMETLLHLGRARAASGLDPLDAWDAAIGAAKRRNRRLTLFYTLTAKARWMRLSGRGGEARPFLETAVDVLESLRADLTDVESQIGVLEDKEATYGELLFAAVEAADAELAMRLMERAKARALLEEIGAGETRMPLNAQQEQDARRLRQELVRFIKLQMEHADFPTLAFESLKDQFASLYRRAGGIVAPRAAARAHEVTRLSAGGNAVLEYFVSEEGIIVAAARDGHLLPPMRLGCNKADIEEMLESFQFEISTRERCHSLTELYSALIKPVENFIEGAERITLVPHGMLHMVPLHALSSRDGVYLVQRHAIHYAPSAAVALAASRKPVESGTAGALLIAGNRAPYSPLPELEHAVDEVEQVSKCLPGAQIAIGTDALRRHVMRRNGDLDILHLACHAEFDHHDPLLSRIYLADGPLYGYEIERLTCIPKLVVLSACETAIHRRAAGDETFGLVRAFLSRGSESVVASLWKVADASTALLMGAFYRERARDPADVAGALRRAQLEVQSYRQYAHPFFWAPYIVIGGTGESLAGGSKGGSA